jgi:hypothetical protein
MTTPDQPPPADTAHRREPRRRRLRRLLAIPIATCLCCAALVVQAPVAGAALPAVSNYTPQIGLLPFAGDVYTFSSNGTLMPISPVSTPASAPLDNLAGNPLNLTWGQFSSATANAAAWNVTYNRTTYTQFLISMNGLVPNGVYSVFYRTFGPDSNNALCPNVEPSLALTAAFPQFQKPDSSSFIASGSGKALFFASVPQNLLAATQLQESVIYHFNGQTYGPVAHEGEAASQGQTPCRSSYGLDAMRQFFIIYK